MDEFRALALSFPGVIDAPHFDRVAFKVTGKKIFCTLHELSHTANIKLAEADQAVYCASDKDFIYPVPNKWGLHGWTTFELKKLTSEWVLDALDSAYKEVISSKKRKTKTQNK